MLPCLCHLALVSVLMCIPVSCTSVSAIRAVALLEAVKHCVEMAAAGRLQTEACGNDNYDQLQARI